MTDVTYRGYLATEDGKVLPVVNPCQDNENKFEIRSMSAEEFEALTTEQKTALYNEGVRIIAVNEELDSDTQCLYTLNAEGTSAQVIDYDALRKNEAASDSNKLGGEAPSYYLPASGTAADSSKLGGKAPEYYLQPRNLLDNSNFLHPINQRGNTTGNINWQYFIDRWILASVVVEEKVYYSINQEGAGIGFSTTSGNNIYLVQRIPKGVINTAKTYTVGYETSSGVKVAATASFNTANEAYDAVNITIPSGTYIRWIALYEGTYTAETLPPYIPKGYAVELAECMRYFERIGKSLSNAFPASMFIAVGTGGEMRMLQGYKVPKRIKNPTIILNGKNTGETTSLRNSITNAVCEGVFSVWNNTFNDRLNTIVVAGTSTIGACYEGYVDIIADL